MHAAVIVCAAFLLCPVFSLVPFLCILGQIQHDIQHHQCQDGNPLLHHTTYSVLIANTDIDMVHECTGAVWDSSSICTDKFTMTMYVTLHVKEVLKRQVFLTVLVYSVSFGLRVPTLGAGGASCEERMSRMLSAV